MKVQRHPHDRAEEEPRQADSLAVQPDSVAGAVLRSARCSANLSPAGLAAIAGISEAALRAWEDGSSPLASAPLQQINQLEAGLLTAGAEPHLVADLAAGAWCDLVIEAIAESADVSCLLADPLAREDTFSELLAWSVTGQPPGRYRACADPGCLPPVADRTVVRKIMQLLKTAQTTAGEPPSRLCPQGPPDGTGVSTDHARRGDARLSAGHARDICQGTGAGQMSRTAESQARLQAARGVPEILAAAYDAFEQLLLTIREHEHRAEGLFAAFLMAAASAADGRDALTFAPSLPTPLPRPGDTARATGNPALPPDIDEVADELADLSQVLVLGLGVAASQAPDPADRAAITEAAQSARSIRSLLARPGS